MNHSNHHRKHHHRHRRKKGAMAGMFFFGGLIKGFVIMLVWNLLIPALFGGPTIGFFQALLLMLLGHLLTGGMCHRGHHNKHWKARFKEKMREKMEGMTPEEREKFRRGFTTGKWEVNVIDVEEEIEETEESSEEDADSKD
ncbi:MAG: hypothetical protein AAF399_25720 [Bacteroidota bacterium]